MDVEMMKNENVENVEDTDVSEGKAKKKGKFLAVKIGGALVLLAAVSIGLLPGLIARYSSQAEKGDEARVAKFDVSEGGTFTDNLIASVSPGGVEWKKEIDSTTNSTNTALIEITNNSEVAVRYSIVLTNVTDNIKPLIIGSDDIKLVKDTKNSNTWVYDDYIDGTTEGEKKVTKTISVDFNWDENKSNDIENANYTDYMGMVDYIKVEVSATQID
jgi:hypothetical protein